MVWHGKSHDCSEIWEFMTNIHFSPQIFTILLRCQFEILWQNGEIKLKSCNFFLVDIEQKPPFYIKKLGSTETRLVKILAVVWHVKVVLALNTQDCHSVKNTTCMCFSTENARSQLHVLISWRAPLLETAPNLSRHILSFSQKRKWQSKVIGHGDIRAPRQMFVLDPYTFFAAY